MKEALFVSLLTISALTHPLVVAGQISEVKDESISIGKMQDIEMKKVGGMYLLLYKDYKYDVLVDYKSIRIKENDYKTLHTKLVEAFDPSRTDIMQLDLPDQTLMISKTKFMGATGIMLYVIEKGSKVESQTRVLTKKQVDKLFGVD